MSRLHWSQRCLGVLPDWIRGRLDAALMTGEEAFAMFDRWHPAFYEGLKGLDHDLEPTSAFREAGHEAGMEWGSEELGAFVAWCLTIPRPWSMKRAAR